MDRLPDITLAYEEEDIGKKEDIEEDIEDIEDIVDEKPNIFIKPKDEEEYVVDIKKEKPKKQTLPSTIEFYDDELFKIKVPMGFQAPYNCPCGKVMNTNNRLKLKRHFNCKVHIDRMNKLLDLAKQPLKKEEPPKEEKPNITQNIFDVNFITSLIDAKFNNHKLQSELEEEREKRYFEKFMKEQEAKIKKEPKPDKKEPKPVKKEPKPDKKEPKPVKKEPKPEEPKDIIQKVEPDFGQYSSYF